MSNNKTFFANARDGKMTLGDIFSEVMDRHTPEQTARVLSAGTAVTTPREEDMLATWQKPFLFARFFLGYGVFLLLCYVMGTLLGHDGGYYLLLVGIPFLVPVTLLLLVWEMNVPRNISLYEVIVIVGLGGILSLIATLVLSYYSETSTAVWAGLVEEPAKLAVIYIILSRKNYKYTINGVLIGAAVGTGFAVMESLFYVLHYGVFEGIAVMMVYFEEQRMSMSEALGRFGMLMDFAIENGLYVALSRAVTSISGHGVFAALYGGALVRAKGEEEIRLPHLFRLDFLAYFAVAILLHALHNYNIQLGLPVLLNGLLPCEYIIIAAIAVALLVNAMRAGVDEAVRQGSSLNGGRLTMAVNRGNRGQGGVQVRLKVTSGVSAGKSVSLTEGHFVTMGRGRDCELSFPHASNVSSTHCRLEVKGGRVVITDLNSTNGTYVNGKRMPTGQVQSLQSGSVIMLANEDTTIQVTF
jgi:RsiW-degrading membrane proteinase PrsW (M82 family)